MKWIKASLDNLPRPEEMPKCGRFLGPNGIWYYGTIQMVGQIIAAAKGKTIGKGAVYTEWLDESEKDAGKEADPGEGFDINHTKIGPTGELKIEDCQNEEQLLRYLREAKIKIRNETNTELKRIWKLDEDGETVTETELEFITDYYVKMAEYWKSKSQPIHSGSGEVFSREDMVTFVSYVLNIFQDDPVMEAQPLTYLLDKFLTTRADKNANI